MENGGDTSAGAYKELIARVSGVIPISVLLFIVITLIAQRNHDLVHPEFYLSVAIFLFSSTSILIFILFILGRKTIRYQFDDHEIEKQAIKQVYGGVVLLIGCCYLASLEFERFYHDFMNIYNSINTIHGTKLFVSAISAVFFAILVVDGIVILRNIESD